MAYIGKTPVLGNFVKLDAITVVNGQAAYTMQNGGVNFTSYDNVNQFLVSLNGILQSPTDSFTVSGSTLTFASNLSTGDVIDFVMVLGNTLDVGTPSDNTVSLAKLTATGTKDATTFLRGDNTFAEAGGGIEMADQWRLAASSNVGVDGDVTSNWERADNTGWGGIGTGLTESSGIFSFPSTGIYIINFTASKKIVNGDSTADYVLNITTDNSTYNQVALVRQGNHGSTPANYTASTNFLFDVTNTTNCKFKFATQSFNGNTSTFLRGDTNINLTCFSVIRLGDT